MSEDRERTLAYTPAGDIDAEPGEVGALALAGLEALLREVEAEAQRTGVQVRSSYLSLALDVDPNANPVELGRRWEDSLEAGAVARLSASVSSARTIAASLRARMEAL